VPVRGNANTRLAKVRDGELDAVVLAYAGLARIGYTDLVTEVFETDEMLPAPGQGALAVECRAVDTQLIELLSAVDHTPTRVAVTAERSLLAALESGCSAPVGAYATERHSGPARLRLDAVVLGAGKFGNATAQGVDVSPGSEIMVVREHGEADATDPGGLGRDLAGRMLARGAARLVGALGGTATGGATSGSAATGGAVTGGAATSSATAGSAATNTATTDREDVHE
jgi:hydroxymethylbilane synthase